MEKRNWRLARVASCALFFLPPFIGESEALEEFFHDYDSPQALAMGNAFTSEAKGYAANYYNPAGIAKEHGRSGEIIPVALESVANGTLLGTWTQNRVFTLTPILNALASSPGKYGYERFNLHPAISRRNFSFAILGSYWAAGRSDGTSVDTFTGYEVTPSVGWGINLAGNTLKLGASLKGCLRNELKGTFLHSDIATESQMGALMKEGLGLGLHLGMIITLPNKYLPTLGFVVKDVLNTAFMPTRFLNAASTGAPDTIPRSFHLAFSIHPNLSKGLATTIAVELKHIERFSSSWQKHVHAGIQLEVNRDLYFWFGINQLYLTGGMGYRARGGDLELATYSQDIGDGTTREEDRRFILRYTIDF